VQEIGFCGMRSNNHTARSGAKISYPLLLVNLSKTRIPGFAAVKD